jgi:hypothetical protein
MTPSTTRPGTATREPITAAQLTTVPANKASWADLQAIFGTVLREQTRCDDPRARTTTGLVAYLDQEPVGWVAVEPRVAYPRLLRMRTAWSGRQEDKAEADVWAVTCFVTRKGYRKRGITYALATRSTWWPAQSRNICPNCS